jgi:hypothetical protein
MNGHGNQGQSASTNVETRTMVIVLSCPATDHIIFGWNVVFREFICIIAAARHRRDTPSIFVTRWHRQFVGETTSQDRIGGAVGTCTGPRVPRAQPHKIPIGREKRKT